MHGTYDHNGVFQPQKVSLGVTQSGRHGLFTGGFLAYPISHETYLQLKQSPERLKVYAAQKGFAVYE